MSDNFVLSKLKSLKNSNILFPTEPRLPNHSPRTDQLRSGFKNQNQIKIWENHGKSNQLDDQVFEHDLQIKFIRLSHQI